MPGFSILTIFSRTNVSNVQPSRASISSTPQKSSTPQNQTPETPREFVDVVEISTVSSNTKESEVLPKLFATDQPPICPPKGSGKPQLFATDGKSRNLSNRNGTSSSPPSGAGIEKTEMDPRLFASDRNSSRPSNNNGNEKPVNGQNGIIGNLKVLSKVLGSAALNELVLLLEKFRGEIGSSGQKGPKGDQGIPGPKGEKGERGARGIKGDSGAEGHQGPRGLRGSRGLRGPQGLCRPLKSFQIWGKKGSDGLWGSQWTNEVFGKKGSGELWNDKKACCPPIFRGKGQS